MGQILAYADEGGKVLVKEESLAILATADVNGTVTPSTPIQALRSRLFQPNRSLGSVLAFADAAGHVYAEWDESKHPRDKVGKFAAGELSSLVNSVAAQFNLFSEQVARPDSGRLDYLVWSNKGRGIDDVVRIANAQVTHDAIVNQFIITKKFSKPDVYTFTDGSLITVLHPRGDDAQQIRVIGRADGVRMEYFPLKSTRYNSYSISRPLYVSRHVENADEIIAWAKSVGFDTTLPAEDMHVTICYSKEPVDWLALDHDNTELEVLSDLWQVMTLGEDGAVVLQFESMPLQARHRYFLDHGASWDYDAYHPHITLTYAAPEGLDLSTIEPYTGRIVLGPEQFAELETGWAEDIKEHAESRWDQPVGVWRTIRGRRVFIRPGDTAREAFDRTLPTDSLWEKEHGKIVAFHGTTASVLKKIKVEGIKVSSKKTFPDITGELYFGDRGESVFVSNSLKSAEWFAQHIKRGKPAVLELRVPAKEWAKFQKDQEPQPFKKVESVFAPVTIKPEWIVGIYEKEKVRRFEVVEPAWVVISIDDVDQHSYADQPPFEIDYAQIKNDLDSMEAKFRTDLREVITQSRNATLATIKRNKGSLPKDYQLPYTKDIQQVIGDALQKAMDRGEADASKEIGRAKTQVKQNAEWDESKHERGKTTPGSRGGSFAPKDDSDSQLDSVWKGEKESDAKKWWYDKLGRAALEYDLILSHEAPGDVVESMLKNGVRGGVSAEDTVFATIGKSSEFITSSIKTRVWFRLPLQSVENIFPDMRYDPDTRFSSALNETGGKLRGVDVSFNSNVPRTAITKIELVTPSGVEDKFYRRSTQAHFSTYAKTPTFSPKAALKWLREKIFWVADVLITGLTEDIRLAIINGLKIGKPTSEIVTDVAQKYIPYLGDLTAVKDGELPTAARLETVVRTNTTEAYNQGRIATFVRPDMMPFLDGIRYSAILDSRTTPVCQYLHNRIFRPEDIVSSGLTPGNHFNCRSLVVPVVVGELSKPPDFKVDPKVYITDEEILHAQALADVKFLEQEDYLTAGDVHTPGPLSEFKVCQSCSGSTAPTCKKNKQCLAEKAFAFDPAQPRDNHGRWVSWVHGTAGVNVDSILSTGLHGGPSGSAVYASKRFDIAINYAYGATVHWGEKNGLSEKQIEDLPIAVVVFKRFDTTATKNDVYGVVHGVVPPESIRKIEVYRLGDFSANEVAQRGKVKPIKIVIPKQQFAVEDDLDFAVVPPEILLAGKEFAEEDGVWRTVRGRKVFIREGETPTEAVKRSIAERSARSTANYIPVTKEKRDKAEKFEATVAKLIGGKNLEDHEPFDVIARKNAVEVKAIMPGAVHCKLTMHPDSLLRKTQFLQKAKMTGHTVAIDARGDKPIYYYHTGVGSFRLSSMQQVKASELKGLIT